MGKIVTLDVSECATGYAVVMAAGDFPEQVLAHGCIVTKPEQNRVSKMHDDVRRVCLLAGDLQGLVERWVPSLIVAELPSWSQSASGAKAQGISLGVLGALRIFTDTPCVWIDPKETKEAATGARKGSKEDVQDGVLAIWPDLEFRNNVEREAVCDALGALVAARATDLYMMACRDREAP